MTIPATKSAIISATSTRSLVTCVGRFRGGASRLQARFQPLATTPSSATIPATSPAIIPAMSHTSAHAARIAIPETAASPSKIETEAKSATQSATISAMRFALETAPNLEKLRVRRLQHSQPRRYSGNIGNNSGNNSGNAILSTEQAENALLYIHAKNPLHLALTPSLAQPILKDTRHTAWRVYYPGLTQEGCDMSGKVKMRCARCGKQFKSASAKQTLCSDCEIKERQARAATKAQGPKSAVAAPVAHPHQPKIVGPGAGILVPGLAPAVTHAEPERIVFGAAAAHAEQITQQHPPSGASVPPTRPTHDKHDKHERQDAAHTQPQRQPKPAPQPKQRKPPAPPFVLTDELRTKIEQRYLELAQPVEFDGIRTRISEELSIPKSAVRHVVQEVRARLQMPSWWELQAFSGSDTDLAHIRAAYEPLLPVPPVGVHKQLAATLGLEPIVVYHGIRRIRAEMHLPQYNPPELHEAPEGSHNEANSSNQSAAPTTAG